MNNQHIFDCLKQPLDVNRVCKRQGGGSRQLSYIESHDAIATLNKIFGYDGWSFELLHFQEIPVSNGKIYRQTVRLLVWFEGREITREDVGVGVATSKSALTAETIEKGLKEAASDGLKRAARTLGEQFGNSLYEKDAPEHRGEQRARLATTEQLVECEALRLKAAQLGFKVNGNAPKKQEEGAEEKRILAKITAFRSFIQEHGDKGQGLPVKEIISATRFKALQETFVSSDAFGDFEAATLEANQPWEHDIDIAEFEDAATRLTGVPVIAENLVELEWSEFAVRVHQGDLRWDK